MILHHQRQQLPTLQRGTRLRRGSVAAAVLVLVGSLVTIANPVAAQSATNVAIKIAGPSVSYFVDGCPEASVADPELYGITFQTTLPNGVVESNTGVRTADRQYSFTTDIRSEDPSGQYSASATCNAPDGTVSFAFAAGSFWVSDGVPSFTAPESDPDDTTPTEPTPDVGDTDPGTSETPAPDAGTSTTPEPDGANTDSTPAPTSTPENPSDGDPTVESPTTDESNPGTTSDGAQDTTQNSGLDPTATPSPTPATASRVTSVQVEPTKATSGETVKTWVQGCPASVDGTSSAVTFSITTPSGAQKVAISDAPSGDGAFSVAIRVPDSPEIGRYSIAAICGLRDGDAFVERREYTASTFEVIANVGLDVPGSTPAPARVSPAQPSSSAPAASRPPAQRPAIGFTG